MGNQQVTVEYADGKTEVVDGEVRVQNGVLYATRYNGMGNLIGVTAIPLTSIRKWISGE